MLHLEEFNEDYYITLPSLHIEGLITGSPFVELNKSTYIQSSSGYTAKIDYSGRGWLSGKKNSFTATLYPEGREKDTLYLIEGQWTGEFSIKDMQTKHTVDTWNSKANKTTHLVIAPIEQQDKLESRRAWRKVADAVAKGDLNTTSGEKTLIENSQRELRKREAAENREWNRIFFDRTSSHADLDRLAAKLSDTLETDKTNGVWVFSAQKAKSAQRPFREGVMP